VVALTIFIVVNDGYLSEANVSVKVEFAAPEYVKLIIELEEADKD
jgi:hypothetical protein